jgi:hypothetical protein
MIVFPRGEIRTWSDLTPGALFGVSVRGETHLAVKIQASGDEFLCAVLTGMPPHYVRENIVRNSLLYFFPNSKIVPVGRRLQFSPDGPRPQPGSLIQSSKGLFLLLQGDQQKSFAFAVQDGRVQEVDQPYVVIQEWKIVLRGLDEHEVIFEWPDKKP